MTRNRTTREKWARLVVACEDVKGKPDEKKVLQILENFIDAPLTERTSAERYIIQTYIQSQERGREREYSENLEGAFYKQDIVYIYRQILEKEPPVDAFAGFLVMEILSFLHKRETMKKAIKIG